MGEMTATEAQAIRKKALEGQEGAVGVALQFIYAGIKSAAESGDDHYDYEGCLKGLNSPQRLAVRKKLQEQGYTLREGGQRDEYMWVCF